MKVTSYLSDPELSSSVLAFNAELQKNNAIRGALEKFNVQLAKKSEEVYADLLPYVMGAKKMPGGLSVKDLDGSIKMATYTLMVEADRCGLPMAIYSNEHLLEMYLNFDFTELLPIEYKLLSKYGYTKEYVYDYLKRINERKKRIGKILRDLSEEGGKRASTVEQCLPRFSDCITNVLKKDKGTLGDIGTCGLNLYGIVVTGGAGALPLLFSLLICLDPLVDDE